MLESTVAYIIIRSLPESVIVILAGFILLDIKIDLKTILKNGIIFGGIVTLVRTLPISFGIHTVLSMMICGFMLAKISKSPLIQPIIATCSILVALALSEGIYVPMATILFNKTTDELLTQSIETAFISIPSLLIFIGIIILMKIIFSKFKNKDSVC
ncbi:MAG: hypothetical protein RRZ84_08635 [Romboutsia sp.]